MNSKTKIRIKEYLHSYFLNEEYEFGYCAECEEEDTAVWRRRYNTTKWCCLNCMALEVKSVLGIGVRLTKIKKEKTLNEIYADAF